MTRKPRKPQRKVTRKTQELFARRIIITVPKAPALVFAGALVISSVRVFPVVSNAIALTLGVISIVTVIVSRRQVGKLRDEISFTRRNVDEDIDAPIMQDLPKVNNVHHDADFTRVPRH